MIKWMIKGHPNRIDAKASKGVPGLTDDQDAFDRKSDATPSSPERTAHGSLLKVSTSQQMRWRLIVVARTGPLVASPAVTLRVDRTDAGVGEIRQ